MKTLLFFAPFIVAGLALGFLLPLPSEYQRTVYVDCKP